MRHSVLLWIIPAYLALCLVLGGASGGGHWANLVLQLTAVPIIIWSLQTKRRTPISSAAKQLMVILTAAAALILLQLVPLPPSFWPSMPSREAIAQGFQILNQPLPWLPVSLAPDRTTASALWMLPAIAVLLGMLRIGAFTGKRLAWTLIAVTAVGVGIGAIQLSGGETSPLYFYTITNRFSATGFFANTNNMASQMVVAVPFLGAIYISAQRRRSSVQKRSGVIAAVVGALGVLVVGIAANGSLAGLGLALPTVAATLLMVIFRERPLPIWAGAVVVGLLVASISVVLSSPFGNNLTTDQARISSDSRYTSFSKTTVAIGDYFPVGSGIGTFPEIYPSYEDPSKVDRWYMNHAHNDYLELILETGLPGMTLIALFILWWGYHVVRLWGGNDVDHFARAATIASAALLAHSFVEFPLRTAALSALFAACCAFIAGARPLVRKAEPRTGGAASVRHLSAD